MTEVDAAVAAMDFPNHRAGLDIEGGEQVSARIQIYPGVRVEGLPRDGSCIS